MTSQEIEIKDKHGRPFFRAAYMRKNKKVIALRCYNRILAEIFLKGKIVVVYVNPFIQISFLQIQQFLIGQGYKAESKEQVFHDYFKPYRTPESQAYE